MTRSELIDALAVKRALSRRTAEEVVGLVFDSLRDVLDQGGRAEIRGFGSFKVRQYEGYQGRNPRTGEEVTVMPKVLPVFKVSKGLHARLNRARLNRAGLDRAGLDRAGLDRASLDKELEGK